MKKDNKECILEALLNTDFLVDTGLTPAMVQEIRREKNEALSVAEKALEWMLDGGDDAIYALCVCHAIDGIKLYCHLLRNCLKHSMKKNKQMCAHTRSMVMSDMRKEEKRLEFPRFKSNLLEKLSVCTEAYRILTDEQTTDTVILQAYLNADFSEFRDHFKSHNQFNIWLGLIFRCHFVENGTKWARLIAGGRDKKIRCDNAFTATKNREFLILCKKHGFQLNQVQLDVLAKKPKY